MKRITLNTVELYYATIYKMVIRIVPLISTLASVILTVLKLLGYFDDTSIVGLIIFDIVSAFYLAVGIYYWNRGVIKDGKFNSKTITAVQIWLIILTILQWNLISYIFLSREFWGFACLFVLVVGFFLNPKSVLAEIVGISLSVTISLFLKGNFLAPIRDSMYLENIVLRNCALIFSFLFIYILVYNGHKFIELATKNSIDLMKENEKLEEINEDVMTFTSNLIEERDVESGEHVSRVQKYTKMLAEEVARLYPEYELTPEKIDIIAIASSLHDVGKICVSDNILLKKGKLTSEEFEQMKLHTIKGAEIVEKLPTSIEKETKDCAKDICLYHHEKYDGNGYPYGLKGEEIPISAQIVSIMDCYDALTSERPYKKPIDTETAITMILNGDCGEFSERVKVCFVACIEENKKHQKVANA